MFERAKGKEEPIPFELLTLSQDRTEQEIQVELERRGLVDVTEKAEVKKYLEQHPWAPGMPIIAGVTNFYFTWMITEKGIQTCLRDKTFGSQPEMKMTMQMYWLKAPKVTWAAGMRFLAKKSV